MKYKLGILTVVLGGALLLSGCSSSAPIPTETINQELQDQRSQFDDKRGSNALAAESAQSIIDLMKSDNPDLEFDLYIKTEVEDSALAIYELGGDEQEFREAISFVAATIVVNNETWTNATESNKKDVATLWAKTIQSEFPEAGGWLIVNNGIREVAEVEWMASEYGREPTVELK